VRRKLGIEPEEFVFLFVGRLQPQKDIPTLLAAYRLVANEAGTGVRLLIAGDGPLRDSLQGQAVHLGLTASVDFLGARGDVPELLQAADAFVMTSITEGQPMALIEAMAAGLPCIGTQVGGIPALLEDGAGVVVPARDPAAIAAGMMRLLHDLSLRHSLAHRARDKAASAHSLSQSTRRYLELLQLAG
jgi:glycosyltransferase involved in cell wall biosynthesis